MTTGTVRSPAPSGLPAISAPEAGESDGLSKISHNFMNRSWPAGDTQPWTETNHGDFK